MNQIFTSAAEALRVARYLSFLLRRPVYRHMGTDKSGKPVWFVTLDQPEN